MRTRFRLVRYFSIASLIGIALAAAILAIVHHRLTVAEITAQARRDSVALARAFSNHVWHHYEPWLRITANLSAPELRKHPQTSELHRFILQLMRGLPVLKVKIYDLQGRTIFSTETSEIGEERSGNPGFIAAQAGEAATTLIRRGELYTFEGTVTDRAFITSYIPLRPGDEGTPIEAIFELYYDVTPLLQRTGRIETALVAFTVLVLGSLYAVLFFVVKRAQARIESDRNRLVILNDINTTVTSHLDLQAVLKVLLDKIDTLLPYSASGVRLLNPDSGRLERLVLHNIDEKGLREALEKSGKGLSELVLENNGPLVIENVQRDQRLPALSDFFIRHHLISYLGLPLTVQGKILGVLSLLTREKHDFTQEEIEFLATLAGYVAVAIHNSQLYEKTKQQASELERLNRAQADFAAMLAHDLRSPLMNIMSVAAMLEDGLLGPITDEQKKWLAKTQAEIGELVDLVNNFLDVSKVEAGYIELAEEDVDLRELIQNSLESYSLLAGQKNILLATSVAPELPPIKADSRRLNQVLNNLLSNALKFTGSGGRIEVGANLLNSREVKLWVRDTGVGIHPEEMGELFQKYRQTASGKKSRYKGTGLGLVVCKTIAEAHGGRVSVESRHGEGSTFTVILPVQPQRLSHSTSESW